MFLPCRTYADIAKAALKRTAAGLNVLATAAGCQRCCCSDSLAIYLPMPYRISTVCSSIRYSPYKDETRTRSTPTKALKVAALNSKVPIFCPGALRTRPGSDVILLKARLSCLRTALEPGFKVQYTMNWLGRCRFFQICKFPWNPIIILLLKTEEFEFRVGRLNK